MHKRKCLSLLILMSLLAGWSGVSAPAHAQNRLSVVASTTIIADVVQHVAGDRADVISLMGFGQDPHTFEPSGEDVALLDEADVVFINGAGFEAGLLPLIEEAVDHEDLFEISLCVEILPFGEEIEHAHEGEHSEHIAIADSDAATLCAEHDSELGIEEAHEEGNDHEHEAHGRLYQVECGLHVHEDEGEEHVEAGSCDPHVWASVPNVMYWTLLARDVLSTADPDNAETYTANATSYLEQLRTTDAELRQMIESLPAEKRILVTNHDSLSYLAHEYGFQVIGTVIPSATTAAEPSARDIAGLLEVISDYGVLALFSENIVSDSLAAQIANETGAGIYMLYTDSLTDAEGEAPTYIDLIRYNISTIVAGLDR